MEGERAPADDQLWICTAEAVLARGRSLLEAVETADRVMGAFWRNRRANSARPGLAKCVAFGARAMQLRH